jgi:hypothetical protein
MFDPASRYADVETATLAGADGAPDVVYKRRRFIPAPGDGATVAEHRVSEGERLDTVAALYLGDPTQFWRICDANLALHPRELEEVGRALRIALPGP